MKKKDKYFMDKALKLGLKGTNLVSPNPRVGCVVVKGGKIAGWGYHKKYGGDHAEVEALRSAGSESGGATLYVTLEPCTHHGRTPPCVERIVRAGIKRVVVGSLDPTLENSGVEFLKTKGIEVQTGVMESEAKKLIQNFTCYNLSRRPLVTYKCAMSLDGKIASATGQSKWISSPRARNYTMLMRGDTDAILVGAATAFKDNPCLSYRFKSPEAKQPLRIILDGKLGIPDNLSILSPGTLIFTSMDAPKEKINRLQKKGVSIKVLPAEKGVLNPRDILKELYLRKVTSLLIEGGGETVWPFIKSDLVDKIIFLYGPVIIGGRLAPTGCGGEGYRNLSEAPKIKNIETFRLGENLVVTGEVR